MHVYADATRTQAFAFGTVGDAQANGFGEFIDYLPASSTGSSPINYALTFAITGSHTATDNTSSNAISALSMLYYNIVDSSTNYSLLSGN
jgi:hypothetical protein